MGGRHAEALLAPPIVSLFHYRRTFTFTDRTRLPQTRLLRPNDPLIVFSQEEANNQ